MTTGAHVASMDDLHDELTQELGIRGDELLHVEGTTLILQTQTFGLVRRSEVFDTQRRRADADHEGLDVLLRDLARHRAMSRDDHIAPDAEAMTISATTRRITLRHDLQALLDVTWLEFVDGGIGLDREARTWRTAGPIPGAFPLTKERRAGTLQVATHDAMPWLSGMIGPERFEVLTVADRKGRFLIALDAARAQVRLPGLAQTVSIAMEGRRLDAIIDYEPLANLDLRVGPRAAGPKWVVHGLEGKALIGAEAPENRRVRECHKALLRSIPRSLAIAGEIRRDQKAWIDRITSR